MLPYFFDKNKPSVLESKTAGNKPFALGDINGRPSDISAFHRIRPNFLRVQSSAAVFGGLDNIIGFHLFRLERVCEEYLLLAFKETLRLKNFQGDDRAIKYSGLAAAPPIDLSALL